MGGDTPAGDEPNPQVTAAAACVGNAALTLVHLSLVVFLCLGAFVLPAWWLPVHAGLIPLAFAAFGLFGGCPMTLVEVSLANVCEEQFPGSLILPPAPLTATERRFKSPQFAHKFKNNLLRRAAYHMTAGQVRLQPAEVRTGMVSAMLLVYAVFLYRTGAVPVVLRQLRCAAQTSALGAKPLPI